MTDCISITKLSWQMLSTEIIGVYSDNFSKPIILVLTLRHSAFCPQNIFEGYVLFSAINSDYFPIKH
jgi:hypothetical protein